jgi:hypothetical protein
MPALSFFPHGDKRFAMCFLSIETHGGNCAGYRDRTMSLVRTVNGESICSIYGFRAQNITTNATGLLGSWGAGAVRTQIIR